jgi:hypothetical protein
VPEHIRNKPHSLFGAYTSVPWSSISGPHPDPSAFLFSLSNETPPEEGGRVPCRLFQVNLHVERIFCCSQSLGSAVDGLRVVRLSPVDGLRVVCLQCSGVWEVCVRHPCTLKPKP